MTDAHYHLIVNHVSMFAILFGLLCLLWGSFRNSSELFLVATTLFLLAVVFSFIATETGEMAEDVVKQMPQVTKELIHEHEAAAKFAQISSIILSVVALAMLWVQKRKPHLFRIFQIITILLALWSSTVFIRTAYLGGYITHSEIRDK